MELQHVNVKLFVKDSEALDPEALVPVFHDWIQNQTDGELLLDVADYRHVPSGPGVLLIGHYANYSLDRSGGRWGVRFNRKAPVGGTNQDRLAQATQAALAFCLRLENDPRLGGMIRFNGCEIEVTINDRLLAPNTPGTRAAADPEFRNFFSTLFGDVPYETFDPDDPRSLFSIRVRASRSFDIATLQENLAALALAR